MSRVGNALRLVVLTVFGIFFAGPLAWLVLAPTKTDRQITGEWPFAFGSFGNVARTWSQLDGFADHLFRRWMENSLIYSFSATLLVLLTAVPAGYGLAHGRFPGRRLVLALTTIAMTLPVTALVLPTFLELNAMHLLGSPLTIVLPWAFFPFGVFLAYLYYATALPPVLLDAARVDGCGEWATFRLVALPLAKPIIALVFFFSFAADWTNFFLPYAVLPDSSQYPVEVGLTDMFVGGSKPVLALAALIATLPLAVVYAVSQRAIVRGLVNGGSTG
ncbi:MAG TPA: carbohydrate ABC transporter permease [Gaiellaceae bacterium]|nr:carbohydrate ABC transporter permease [Gaiellaceae bacterium]